MSDCSIWWLPGGSRPGSRSARLTARARVHRVRHALAADHDEMPIVAGTGGRRVVERDQPAGAAPARLGRLDGDPAGVPVGAPAQGAHLAVQAEQRVADPGGPRGHGHRVDRMTLGDAVQRQGQRRVLAHGAPGVVQFQLILRGGRVAGGRAHRLGAHLARRGAKAPCRGQPAHRDVEQPAGLAPQLQRQGQKVEQLGRQRDPCPDRRGVQPAEVTLGPPQAGLRLDPLDRRGQRGGQAGIWGRQGRGPAAAHRGTRQGHRRGTAADLASSSSSSS